MPELMRGDVVTGAFPIGAQPHLAVSPAQRFVPVEEDMIGEIFGISSYLQPFLQGIDGDCIQGEAFGVPGVSRFNIRAIFDGRLFESFHIDVGVGDSIVSPVDLLQSTDFLSFAGLKPVQIPCYPIN